MITAKVGNLLKSITLENLDSIINAANGIGPMGAGIAGAIRKYGGKEIQNDAFRVCNELDPMEGDAYSTISGKLKNIGVKRIIHAVTMKQPGGDTSLDICKNAFNNALKLAKSLEIKKIGCTALGTGIGGLDPIEVAKVMVNVAKQYNDIDIIFIDFNDSFINTILQEIK